MQRKPFSYLKTLMNIMRGKFEIYEEFQNYIVKLNKNYYCITVNENENVIKKTSNANMTKVKIHD